VRVENETGGIVVEVMATAAAVAGSAGLGDPGSTVVAAGTGDEPARDGMEQAPTISARMIMKAYKFLFIGTLQFVVAKMMY